MDKKIKKSKHVLFWIKSSRGTNQKKVFEIPDGWGKREIKSALERWAFGFGAFLAGENLINYGWKIIKILPRKILEKEYEIVWEKERKARERRLFLAAMFNIKKLN